MAFSRVKVIPFIGENYGVKKPWGVSVLVLGESHYSRDSETLTPDFTKAVVQKTLEGANYPFFTKAVGVFHGRWPDQSERRRFWNSAAFCNYVQETVGPSPRVRPTLRMWEEARAAFEEVLIELEPEFVLVLGKELWWHLPESLERGPVVTLPDGRPRESRLYFNDAGCAFVFGIDHPCSPGWTYGKWTPWVTAALEQAKLFQAPVR